VTGRTSSTFKPEPLIAEFSFVEQGNSWRKKTKEKLGNPVSPGKWPIKHEEKQLTSRP